MAEVLMFAGERAFFSERTPHKLRYLLNHALCAATPDGVEALLLEARRRWPEEPDAHIGLYKFYFVRARYQDAEAAVWAALRAAAGVAGFGRNYRRLHPGSADWSRRQGGERLYLFSLKALGVIRLRRARVTQARCVLEKLLELDPVDEIGGGAFLQIARSFSEDDE
jgi:tetratricopeptide (TPR) repeat protein